MKVTWDVYGYLSKHQATGECDTYSEAFEAVEIHIEDKDLATDDIKHISFDLQS